MPSQSWVGAEFDAMVCANPIVSSPVLGLGTLMTICASTQPLQSTPSDARAEMV